MFGVVGESSNSARAAVSSIESAKPSGEAKDRA
jgi:hypothetical protein